MPSAIYSIDGVTITDGLQGCLVCDEALIAARNIARDRRERVILKDDDGEWLVGPRGGVRKLTTRMRRDLGLMRGMA